MKTITLLLALILAQPAFSNDDPMPMAHDGLGCMTDSECESIEECDERCQKELDEMFPQTDEYTIGLRANNNDAVVTIETEISF